MPVDPISPFSPATPGAPYDIKIYNINIKYITENVYVYAQFGRFMQSFDMPAWKYV